MSFYLYVSLCGVKKEKYESKENTNKSQQALINPVSACFWFLLYKHVGKLLVLVELHPLCYNNRDMGNLKIWQSGKTMTRQRVPQTGLISAKEK